MSFAIVRALAVAGAMLFAMTVAEAQPMIPQKFTVRGASADASFEATEGNCIVRGSYVTASDSTENRLPYSALYLTAYGYDQCQGTYLHYYEAYVTDLSPTAFTVSNNGRSATLNTSVQLYDWVTGESCTGDVNLTWTATGAVERWNSVYHSRSGDYKLTSISRGVGRPATAVGSIIGCDGNNYAPGTSNFGYISTSSSKTITRTMAP